MKQAEKETANSAQDAGPEFFLQNTREDCTAGNAIILLLVKLVEFVAEDGV